MRRRDEVLDWMGRNILFFVVPLSSSVANPNPLGVVIVVVKTDASVSDK
jgi:hypothetical protein